MLPNRRSLIKKHLPVLHSDSHLKTYFQKILSVRFLREIEIFNKYYLHHFILKIKMKNKNEKQSYVIKDCDQCDICKNYLISDNTFACKVTNKK